MKVQLKITGDERIALAKVAGYRGGENGDASISGIRAHGRRPAFVQMLKDAVRQPYWRGGIALVLAMSQFHLHPASDRPSYL